MDRQPRPSEAAISVFVFSTPALAVRFARRLLVPRQHERMYRAVIGRAQRHTINWNADVEVDRDRYRVHVFDMLYRPNHC